MELSAPQHIFLNQLKTKFRGYVGGMGSGKTFIGCVDLILFLAEHPATTVGYFGPTYGAIRDIFFPTFEEAAEKLGFKVRTFAANKEVELYRNKHFYGKVICRSMDAPNSIVGYKIARAFVDEIDTLPFAKAELSWQKIIARLRLVIPNVINVVTVTTTPEGFGFTYKYFKQSHNKDYSLVQASSYENQKYLSEGYIESLVDTYPENLVQAYVNGEFVNLVGLTVYTSFDRKFCHKSLNVKPQERLYIGQDFNVGQMASVIFVKRPNYFLAVGEITDGIDTPDTIRTIKELYPDHPVTIYPDASGANRKSVNAGNTDILLLKAAKFKVMVNKSNPRIKDRVNTANKRLETGEIKINTKLCPELTKCLEQQAYNASGLPDKTGGFDHMTDAFGYFIAQQLPIKTRSIGQKQIVGLY